MTTAEVQKLKPGLYEIFWKEDQGGGSSLAAVGVTADGSRWLAPINWIRFSVPSKNDHWESVQTVQLITSGEPFADTPDSPLNVQWRKFAVERGLPERP